MYTLVLSCFQVSNLTNQGIQLFTYSWLPIHKIEQLTHVKMAEKNYRKPHVALGWCTLYFPNPH